MGKVTFGVEIEACWNMSLARMRRHRLVSSIKHDGSISTSCPSKIA